MSTQKTNEDFAPDPYEANRRLFHGVSVNENRWDAERLKLQREFAEMPFWQVAALHNVGIRFGLQTEASLGEASGGIVLDSLLDEREIQAILTDHISFRVAVRFW